MPRTKLALRFAVTFVAFTVLIQPFLTLLTPPDAHLQLIAAGIAGLVSIPVSVVFVHRSCSLERLGKYFLAVSVLVVFTTLAVGSLRAAVRSFVGYGWTVQTLFDLTAIVAAYTLAFRLVYRGGYDRLKTRLA